jgi:hypothetical protein
MKDNIKQKFFKSILSFSLFMILSGCQSGSEKVTVKTPEVQEVEIAILMPMTGDQAVLGKQYNQLIKMGLEDSLSTYANVTSYDGADERQINAAMEKIVARKTKIILGPLLSPLTSLIAEKAKKHGIIVITMSNNPVLATEKLFVFGHAPLKQVDRMVNYLLDNEYKNFITLLPAGNYSKTVAQLVQDMMIQKGATLVRAEYYSSTPESINKAVSMASDAVDNLNELDDVSTKPVVYIADDPKNLTLVFSSIHAANLDKKALITGDNRIDINYSEEINLLYTGSLNDITFDVGSRAKSLGISHLSFIHRLAYDLGRMTGTYIGDQYSSVNFLARLNSSEPYIGIAGKTYFIDSIAQRGYDIIKREGRTYTTLEVSK